MREKRTGCSHDGCTGKHYARGMCFRHYQAWRRTNTEQISGFTFMERYWMKVDKDGPVPQYRPELGPCWLWTGAVSTNTGYGNFDRTQQLPHRISYRVFIGPIPDGYEVDHLCRVRLCVNPAHLQAVTTQVNAHRSNSVSGVNSRKTECANGHPLVEDNLQNTSDGRRRCKICARNRTAAYRKRLEDRQRNAD